MIETGLGWERNGSDWIDSVWLYLIDSMDGIAYD